MFILLSNTYRLTSDLLSRIRELKSLPEELHLLCPRKNDNDMEQYNRYTENENKPSEAGAQTNPEILERISEAAARREKFLSCIQLLAFSGEEVEAQQQWLWRRLKETLERCDICIKEYYRGKIWLIETLGESYDESEVEKFSKMLDDWDIARVGKNLDKAASMLASISPGQRKISALDRASMLSIFEALSSTPVLGNDTFLLEHFDGPFTMVQSSRPLKITEYVPAATQFLFDKNKHRNDWAVFTWSKLARPPTTTEFDCAIKEPLLAALRRASSPPFDPDFVDSLWRGVTIIIKGLNKDQITHNLRGLELDPCRLSVDHLAIQAPALRSVINTIHALLKKSPNDFWDAMQTISPQAIIEQIFYNPQYEIFLTATDNNDSLAESPLRDMLSWIDPFIMSLKNTHQPQACRFLVHQLLNRLQEPRFPTIVKYHCFRSGLMVLYRTLRSFTDNEDSRGSVATIVLSEMMEVISDNIKHFLNPPRFEVDGSEAEISVLCMDVVRNTLALECQSLKSDYETILRDNTLQHGVSTYTAPIWDAVVQHLDEKNLALSSAALRGILPLVGLEKFQTRGENTKEKTHFNVIYGHLTHLACQILERLSDFRPEHLDELFKAQETNGSLTSALFSADLNTYQAAVDLIKAVSGQLGRKEAISHLLQSFCASTMFGFSWSFRRISNMKTFASAPRMLKTGTDIIEVLCDSQTGILRTRKLNDPKEVYFLQRLWEYQWLALSTIFSQTEKWHRMGVDRSIMLEFCRDSIQFAELLFDQFPIFATAVGEADPAQANSAKSNLLRYPTTTMNAMVKWLRLKDEYLATTLVGIVSKVLRRLGDLNATVQEEALDVIKDVALTAKIKTILTDSEKAELVRSMEAYYKKPLVTPIPAPPPKKKQSSITAFAKPVDPKTIVKSESKPIKEEGHESEIDIPDDVLIELSGSIDLHKARIASQKKPIPRPTAPSKPLPPVVPLVKPAHNVLSFREKREREKEAKKKRDMIELAKVKKNLPLRGMSEQTASQGSGLSGLNIGVVEHKPADSMMVSSDSDSDSDSDDNGDEDMVGKRVSAKPDAVRAYEESRKKLLQRVPVKKAKIIRSAKDMRARLAPDLSSLHKTLLSWDFFATTVLPPNCGRTDYTLVSNVFANALEYQKTFEPLLILEAWQGFQTAREDATFKEFEIKVANRLSVDSFVEVSTIMEPQQVKDLGLGEADLVLLSRSNKPATDSGAPHCLGRISGIKKKKGTVEVSYRINPSGQMASGIGPGGGLFGVKITSLTPLEREYGALMALQYYDLSEEIIRAKPSPILNYGPESLKSILATYDLNPAQAKAIKSAVDNDAFTLIQGPPGSGKTKTIVAIVGALLTPILAERRVSQPKITSDSAQANKSGPSKKLLVCAPSNAAVDELVMRFKEGVKTLNGKTQPISVIRLGRSDAINANVLDVTLDELVNAKLNQSGQTKNGEERDLQSYFNEHKETSAKFIEIRQRIDQCRARAEPVSNELEREFDLLKRKKAQLSQAIDNARDKNHAAARNAELTRRRIQQEIIDGAHVICSTLSGSGHEMFQSLSIEFETVIIDEAAQSIELSALIPLKYGCSKCVLVGDPKQLPPTVLSKEASRFQYEQSLFVRMQANHPNDVHLLDTQYRMHPEISKFPSQAFYDGKLQDGPGMAPLRKKPWHGSELLGPYRFFDVQGMHSSAAKGHSLINIAELTVAMRLYERLLADYRNYDFAGKIGIITPYKGQLRELKSRFAAKYGSSIFTAVEFNTTDAFQGRECEVIIFSCVRASDRGIGFLSDIRRMNVGLTRAKSSLWVLGNSQSLVRGEFWRALIHDARERQLYTEGDILRILQKTQISLDMELNNVEMVDAPAEVGNIPTPSSRPGSSMAGSSNSRPPSRLSNPQSAAESLPSELPSGSAAGMPIPCLPDGPSGGKSGLNDLAMCGYCGSHQHMTHNCDNIDAKIACQGTCRRCGDETHSIRDCKAERCVQCGETGHLANDCKSTTVLPKWERNKVIKEEAHHKNMQQARIERQKQKAIAAHDPKIPLIQVPGKKSSTENIASQHNNGPGKRKRSDPSNSHASGGSKLMRLDQSTASSTPPKDSKGKKQDSSTSATAQTPAVNLPKGPRGRKADPHSVAPPPSDLVIPSRDSRESRPISTEQPSPAANKVGDSTSGPPMRPKGDRRPPPPMRKKKPADVFIRPKRR
ncbi:helicase [Trichophyton mentagrophytes]|nr:helicase [Trichophyton mentagrophytes]